MAVNNDDHEDKIEIFADKADSMLTELVVYIRKFLQNQVDEHNKNLKAGDEPKCVICELEDFLEELSLQLTMTTPLGNESHDAYHDILFQKHGFTQDGL